MNKKTYFFMIMLRVSFFIILAFFPVTIVAKEVEPASLAVLVDYEPADKEFAEKLQSLLEAEAAMQWDGRLVERAELNRLLGELKLSVSGLVDPNNRLQLGKLVQMDCLLTVRAAKDSVKVTVTLFPSTTIIYEKIYRQRLEPQPIAANIVTNAIRAVKEHNRDSDNPQVSIGSFYYADPHRKFLDFSIDISLKLRQELAKDKTIVLTERLFPSDLLSEFELVRGGFTEQIVKNLSAPPSDILLYGEFLSKPEQNLTKPFAELDFTLFIVSPTEMCENHRMEFSCHSNEPEVVIERALELIEQVVGKVRTKLEAGEQRNFSQKEFEEFKRQAFRLMPNPPLDDGDFYKQGHYRGPSQYTAKPEEYERALHMLECAMLFKGDDTQVLVCTGAILDGMAGRFTKKYSVSAKNKFLQTSLELIERAYFIDSNWNTRGMYSRFCLSNFSAYQSPSYTIKGAKQIWNTRNTESWHPHQVHAAFSILFAKSDFQQQTRLFIETATEYEKKENGLRELKELFNNFYFKVTESRTNPQEILQMQHFAEQLIKEKSPFLQSLGHILILTIYFKMEESEKDFILANEVYEHLRYIINIEPELSKTYSKQFKDVSYSGYIRSFLQKYKIVEEKYNLKNNSSELIEIYIKAQMEEGEYNAENSILFYNLLPSMWECGKYQKAYDLITQFLEHYEFGGSGDHDRMWLSRQRTRFLFAQQGRTPSTLDQIKKIQFDDGLSGCVIKVVNAGKDIYGIRGDPDDGYRNGKAFQLPSLESQAYILKQISGEVSDLACTNTYIGIATKIDGFYLIDIRNYEVRHLTPQNSGLPYQRVTLVCDSGKNFFIGIPDKENLYTHIYLLNPDADSINDTNTKFDSHPFWRLKSNPLETEKSIVIPQTWQQRTAEIDNRILEFLCDHSYAAIKNVTVKSNKNDILLNYRGFELSYVYDFTLWQGQLIFATGNGLYISEPHSNEVRCLISELDLLFFSLCPLDNCMYIGTSDGLYCIDASRFLDIVAKVK